MFVLLQSRQEVGEYPAVRMKRWKVPTVVVRPRLGMRNSEWEAEVLVSGRVKAGLLG